MSQRKGDRNRDRHDSDRNVQTEIEGWMGGDGGVTETNNGRKSHREREGKRERERLALTLTYLNEQANSPFQWGNKTNIQWHLQNPIQNPRQTFNGIFSQICNGLIQSLPIRVHSLHCAHKHTCWQSGSVDIHTG